MSITLPTARGMELRPLGFGEIFDRAITLYVKNFIPFAGIIAVLVVPLAVMQYFLDQSSAPQWDQMIQIFQHPGKTPPTPVMPAFFTNPALIAVFIGLMLVVYGLWPFAMNACVVGIARLYRNRPVEFSACYRAALRRWPSVIGLLLLEACVFIAWYIAFLMVMVFTVVIAILLFRVAAPLGVLVGIIGFLVNIAVLFSAAPLFVALTFAMNAVVVEERPVFSALGLGFTRVFNRREFWRAMLISISALFILISASSLVSALVILAMFFHAILLEVILTTLFRAAIAPFTVVLLAIYYFDVRIRREGYEIEAGLDRLAAAGPQVA